MLMNDVKNVGTLLIVCVAGMIVGYVKCLNDAVKADDEIKVKPTKHTILKVSKPKK